MLSLRYLRLNQLRRFAITSKSSLFTATTDYSFSAEVIDPYIDYNYLNPLNVSAKHKNLINSMFFWSKCVTEGKQPLQQLLEDNEFQKSCSTIVRSVADIESIDLILLLQSLLVMDLDPNTRVIRYLENEVLWRSRNLSLKKLLRCLSYHVRYQSTEQQKQVVRELIVRIQSNLDEAKDENDVLMMFRLSKCFTEECMERIEKTALEMIVQNSQNQFKADSLCYLLVLLSLSKRRTKPLIRAVINKLINLRVEEMNCSPTHLINMISALNRLNFPDFNLLQKSCDLLCNMNFIEKVSPSSRRELLSAVSQLNWSHPRLIDYFIEKITDNPNNFSPQDLFAFIISCARLYHHTPYMHEVLSSYVIPYVKQEDFNSYSWLIYVWSLSILESAPFELITSVLNSKFCDQALNESQYYESIITKLKLLNIKAVAEIEMNKEIDCPDCLKTVFEMPKKSNELEVFQNSIIESLNSFMPKEKYIATNLATPLGFTIDAEFVINSSSSPLPIAEYGIFGADINKQTKPLPSGFRRVAVLCFGYSDTLLDRPQQIGVHRLAIRLLKKLNYSVLVLNETSIPIKMSSIKKVQRLQKMINNLFDSID